MSHWGPWIQGADFTGNAPTWDYDANPSGGQQFVGTAVSSTHADPDITYYDQAEIDATWSSAQSGKTAQPAYADTFTQLHIDWDNSSGGPFGGTLTYRAYSAEQGFAVCWLPTVHYPAFPPGATDLQWEPWPSGDFYGIPKVLSVTVSGVFSNCTWTDNTGDPNHTPNGPALAVLGIVNGPAASNLHYSPALGQSVVDFATYDTHGITAVTAYHSMPCDEIPYSATMSGTGHLGSVMVTRYIILTDNPFAGHAGYQTQVPRNPAGEGFIEGGMGATHEYLWTVRPPRHRFQFPGPGPGWNVQTVKRHPA